MFYETHRNLFRGDRASRFGQNRTGICGDLPSPSQGSRRYNRITPTGNTTWASNASTRAHNRLRGPTTAREVEKTWHKTSGRNLRNRIPVPSRQESVTPKSINHTEWKIHRRALNERLRFRTTLAVAPLYPADTYLS